MLRDAEDFFISSYPNELYLTIVADAQGKAAEYEFSLSFRRLGDAEIQEIKENLEKIRL